MKFAIGEKLMLTLANAIDKPERRNPVLITIGAYFPKGVDMTDEDVKKWYGGFLENKGRIKNNPVVDRYGVMDDTKGERLWGIFPDNPESRFFKVRRATKEEIELFTTTVLKEVKP